MPKFMKDRAIELIDGGIESYLLGLYGLTLPFVKRKRNSESKYAPVIGLFGTCAELITKACLVQAFGISVMYKKNDRNHKVYKNGTECVEKLKKAIDTDDQAVSFLWEKENHTERKDEILGYLNKFRLLQDMRANGLHAGKGCSRDIAVVTANEIYHFTQSLAKSRRLKPYLKSIPAPEATVRDREAIIEDLSRRILTSKDINEKVDALRGMYIVLPYIPEIVPDWMENYKKINILPPTNNDLKYLVNSLNDAHSIYLLKNRGGKDGFPVRVDPKNPNALPIAIQNIKRTINNIPDQFNNDALTSNTRLENGIIDLPVEDFLIDLYALGPEKANIIQQDDWLTAQQVWPFVASAYSTAGTPWPCWDLIKYCNELDKLMSYLKRANKLGNGYFKRRYSNLLEMLQCYKEGRYYKTVKSTDKIFDEAVKWINTPKTNNNPFTPQFIKNNMISERIAIILGNYLSGKIDQGNALEDILAEQITKNSDRHVVRELMHLCNSYDQRRGVIAVIRSTSMNLYRSAARKQMFFMDISNVNNLINNTNRCLHIGHDSNLD